MQHTRYILALVTLSTGLCAQPLPPPTAPPLPEARKTSYHQVYAQVATYGGLALADYWTTQRGLRSHATGREANPLLACNGGRTLCTGRYVALNAGVTAGLWLVGRHVTPRLPRTSRRVVNGLVWAMLGGRAAVVVNNYKEGSR